MSTRFEKTKSYFAGNRVLITGAASGIGKALASEFAEGGADLFLLDKDKAALDNVVVALTQQFSQQRIEPVIIDLSQGKQIETLPNTVFEETDIFINNAGIGAKGYFAQRSINEFEQIIDVNFLSVVRMTHRYLNANVDGHTRKKYIITVSSPAAFVDTPYMSAYSSSKKAVQSFINSISFENPTVHFLTVIPGPTKTNFGTEFKEKIEHGWFYNTYLVMSPQYVAHKIILGLKKKKKQLVIPVFLSIIYSTSFLWAPFTNLLTTLFFRKLVKNQKVRNITLQNTKS